MSDILIRGMEMPKENDYTIAIVYGDGVVTEYHEDYWIRGADGEKQLGIAIPVPPHGDLIDRNVLYHNMFIGPDGKVFPDRDVDNFPHEMRFEDIKRFIRKAQTVIQACE